MRCGDDISMLMPDLSLGYVLSLCVKTMKCRKENCYERIVMNSIKLGVIDFFRSIQAKC